MRSTTTYVAMAALAILAAACGPDSGSGSDAALGVDAPANTADAAPPPDGFNDNIGQPCDTAIDCPGGHCVDGPVGGLCTYPCTDECPFD